MPYEYYCTLYLLLPTYLLLLASTYSCYVIIPMMAIIPSTSSLLLIACPAPGLAGLAWLVPFGRAESGLLVLLVSIVRYGFLMHHQTIRHYRTVR